MTQPVLPFPFVPEKTVVDGRYLVKGTVGRERGGMGLVYVVSEAGLDRRSVLKMLLPELHPEFQKKEGKQRVDARELLKNEARVGTALVSRYGNDCFAQVFNHGSLLASVATRKGRTVELDLPWFVMEFLPGHSFMAVIQHYKERETLMPLPMVLTLAAQAAHALSLVHEAGFVHRDVKPGNIYLHERQGRSSVVKIIDLGVTQEVGASCLTGTGTTKYSAPEILLGTSARESTQSDIYPLALVVYELAALRGPYEASSKKEWRHVHAYGTPPLLSDFRRDAPRALTQLLAAALESNANARPNAREFANALALILKQQTEGTTAADDQVADLLRTLADRAHRQPSARTRSSSARSNQALTAPPDVQRGSLPSSEAVFFSRKRRPRVNADPSSSYEAEVSSSASSSVAPSDDARDRRSVIAAPVDAPALAVADTTPDAPLPFPGAASIASRDSYSQVSEAEISSQIVGMTNMPVIRSMGHALEGLGLGEDIYESSPTTDRSPLPLSLPTPPPNTDLVRRASDARFDEPAGRRGVPGFVPSSVKRRKQVQWGAALRGAAWTVAFVASVTVVVVQIRNWPSEPATQTVSSVRGAMATDPKVLPLEARVSQSDASGEQPAPIVSTQRSEPVPGPATVASANIPVSRVPRRATPSRVSVPVQPSRAMRVIDEDDAGSQLEFKRSFSH